MSSAASDDQSESKVLSRLHLNEDQKKVKDLFIQKQRDDLKHEIMKDKQRRKRVTPSFYIPVFLYNTYYSVLLSLSLWFTYLTITQKQLTVV